MQTHIISCITQTIVHRTQTLDDVQVLHILLQLLSHIIISAYNIVATATWTKKLVSVCCTGGLHMEMFQHTYLCTYTCDSWLPDIHPVYMPSQHHTIHSVHQHIRTYHLWQVFISKWSLIQLPLYIHYSTHRSVALLIIMFTSESHTFSLFLQFLIITSSLSVFTPTLLYGMLWLA